MYVLHVCIYIFDCIRPFGLDTKCSNKLTQIKSVSNHPNNHFIFVTLMLQLDLDVAKIYHCTPDFYVNLFRS